MNRVELTGRIVRDPEIRWSQGEKSMCVARCTMAVDRKIKTADKSADFINIISFGKMGEFVEKFVKKGVKFGVCGRIQTGEYTDKDGKKVYTTDVVAEEWEFEEKKTESTEEITDLPITSGFTPISNQPKNENPFVNIPTFNIPDGVNEDLPFASISR